HFRKIMAQDAGAKYYKVDLHIHTPSSTDAQGSKRYNYSQVQAGQDIKDGYVKAREIAGQVLDKLVAEGVSVAAFTDHNSPGYVYNKDFSSRSWYELINEEYEQRQKKDPSYPELLLLPGVEITTDRIHVLGIFDNQEEYAIFKIASLLHSVGVQERQFGKVDDTFGTKTIWEVADAIDDLGGICIPAHINARSRSLLQQYQPPDMEIERLVQHRAIHVFGVVPTATPWPDRRTYQSIIENKTFQRKRGGKKIRVSYHDWMVKQRGAVPQHLPALGYMMNSDAHAIAEIGERFSWVKMDELSFRSLAAALRNPFYCIAPTQVKPVSSVRSQVLGISMEGGFADGLHLRFNEHFNCIVGRPNTGKTTLMRVIHDTFEGKRLGLRIRDGLEGAINDVASGLWEEIKGKVLTTKGALRKRLSEGAKRGIQAAFLETRDLPWTIFVFFFQEQPDGHKVIYAAERRRPEGGVGADGREDEFHYYRSDPQPADLDRIGEIHFSEISRRDFRNDLARPGFYFERIGLGDEEKDFQGARYLLDRHLLRVMDGYNDMRPELFRLCNDLEKAAEQTPPDTETINESVTAVRQLLEEMHALRTEFAKRFNATEQEHALRIAFRKGQWQKVIPNTLEPSEVPDFVCKIRQYLHGQDYYDLLEMTFYQKKEGKKRSAGWEEVPFSELGSGRRSLMALRLVLNSSWHMAPVFIDGPERWLDNDTLIEFCDMRRIRGDQLLLFTRNPNIAVLGNAEQTIVLDVDKDRTQAVAIGGLEDESVAAELIRLLEGGNTAFQRKLLRYQAELRRLGIRIELQRPE
ncbi:MAG: PHP domain-containing protein, partial [Anaerolineae bacterium]